jgi:hypothetical protein
MVNSAFTFKMERLVADSRWRYGYLILATDTSLYPATYHKETERFMVDSPTT